MRLEASRVAVLVLGILASGCGNSVDPQAFSQALGAALERQSGIVQDRTLTAALLAFYDARQRRPSWTDSDVVEEAVGAIMASTSHGLNPEDYNGTSWSTEFRAVEESPARDQARVEDWADFDSRMTAALLRLGRDVSIGRMPPETIGARWTPRLSASDLGASLANAWRDGALAKWLDTIAPPHAEYRRLRGSLEKLTSAVPRDDRQIARVQSNLDRWRWLPTDLGQRHLIVNIPEFVLRAKEGDRTAFQMRVVVGGPGDRQTPLFSDVMETVVFNPYWHIPKSIAQGETMPAIAKDPSYIERHDIEVLDAESGHRHVDPDDVDWNDKDAVKSLVFRQRPGDGNALGDVKFLFPNRHAVYMHDTPSTPLFDRPVRALSHGCVRVAEPEVLAAYVLGDQQAWTPAAISTAMRGDREQYVKLRNPLPVHLVYFTVVAEDGGTLRIFDDIYKLDEKLLSRSRRAKV